MAEQLMYRKHAMYYDLIYHDKEYAKETEDILRIIKKYKKSTGNDLLDVACGTGNHLVHFRKRFSCTGADINKEVLAIARKKNPRVTFIKEDMSNLQERKHYDVITCLFSSIGYLKTEQKLKRAFGSFASHLNPGGIIIIEPWFAPDAFKVGSPHMTTYDSKKLKIVRMNVSKKKGNLSILDMHWMVAEQGKDVLHFVDHHELLLTPIPQLRLLMEEAGLNVIFLKKGTNVDGRDRLVGIKRNGA